MTYREKKSDILTFIQPISKIPLLVKIIDNFGCKCDYQTLPLMYSCLIISLKMYWNIFRTDKSTSLSTNILIFGFNTALRLHATPKQTICQNMEGVLTQLFDNNKYDFPLSVQWKLHERRMWQYTNRIAVLKLDLWFSYCHW